MSFKARSSLLRLLVVAVLIGLTGRLVWVQVVRAEEIKGRVEEMRLVKKPVAPVRGTILDRKERVLALSVPSYTVVADVAEIKPDKQQEDVRKLTSLLQADSREILQKLQENRSSRYLPLKRELDLELKRKVEELKIPWIYFEEKWNRKYPQGFAANHILGYMGDTGGQYGLEKRYEQDLAGKPGYTLAEWTSKNIPIEGTIKRQEPPQPGLNLMLTVDVSLQQLVEAKLDEVVKKEDAKRALVIAMNVHTGEILTLAMRPGAHPGDRSTWGNPVDYNRINNWAVTPMSPGSIFKTVTVAAALEERAITLNSTFLDSGRISIDGWTITNWDGYIPPKPHPESVSELMQRSSNVGLIQIGQRMGPEKFAKYLKGFGFMDTTGIDLSYEEGAYGLDHFAEKRQVDWANMYIGQHLEVTPLQMITAVAAIANGGRLVQPHLVREVRGPEGNVVKVTSTAPRRQVISEATAKEVQQIMVDVVTKSSVRTLMPKGYTVGGKTGTAQKFERTGTMKERNLANFVGFAPASNPQVAMLVMIDEPRPPGLGGVVAAPLFGELMPHVMRAVGIAPDSAAAMGEEEAPPKVVEGVVPGVEWLPVAWARERLAEAGFTARVTGQGELVGGQSVKAGSAARKGSVVELALAPRSPGNETVRVPDFKGLSLTEAGRLAAEVGLTLKAGGSGFVADQEPRPGTVVPARSTFSVRLAPRR